MSRFLVCAILTLVSFSGICRATEEPAASVAPRAAMPKVKLKVPKYGTTNATLTGRVSGVNAAACKAAVFIGLDQAFYNKPTFAAPDTPLAKNGSFACNISTGQNDPFAQKIVVFIVPAGFALPMVNGASTFPQSIIDAAVAYAELDRAEHVLAFAKWKWNVKSGLSPLGPGPNRFSASSANVSVDKTGALHLSINQDAQNAWQCAEIVSQKLAGYGNYRFTVSGANLQALNENAVFGLFPYDDTVHSDPSSHSELDFEFSRWGNAADVNNAQFVVQPFNVQGHLQRFPADQAGSITLEMDWRMGSVAFTAASGAQAISRFTYANSDVPAPGNARLHLNLWLFNGAAPSDGKPQEVIVQGFKYKK